MHVATITILNVTTACKILYYFTCHARGAQGNEVSNIFIYLAGLFVVACVPLGK